MCGNRLFTLYIEEHFYFSPIIVSIGFHMNFSILILMLALKLATYRIVRQ
jgi:hypothetical protein